ncbi:hypothetical protein NPIL_319341 [Nephila pilipes]|uniref:Uncharacterized protein n=1 Tax=Nephila pilipes TaxID=299642 RepID=A0A8X6N2J2_NEPPI|nr:hypothetical protein NPIL_319341 [Nephila pilipes]
MERKMCQQQFSMPNIFMITIETQTKYQSIQAYENIVFTSETVISQLGTQDIGLPSSSTNWVFSTISVEGAIKLHFHSTFAALSSLCFQNWKNLRENHNALGLYFSWFCLDPLVPVKETLKTEGCLDIFRQFRIVYIVTIVQREGIFLFPQYRSLFHAAGPARMWFADMGV